MIRRSLRIGTRAGAVAALVYAAFKVVQARRPTPALPDADQSWPAKPRSAGSPDGAAVPGEPELVRPSMLETTSLRKRSSPAAEPPPSEPEPVAGDQAPEPADLQLVVVEEPEYDLTSTAPPIVSPMAPSAFVVEVSPTDEVVVEIEADDDEIVIIDQAGDGTDGTDGIVVVSVDVDAAPAAPAPPPPPAPAIAEKAEASPAAGSGTAGKAAAGKPRAGTAAATRAVGTKAVGTKAVGTKAVGTKAVGTKAVGKKAAGTKAAGTKAAGTKAAGTKAAGTKAAGTKAAGTRAVAAWVEPSGGVCPTTHPVKAKLRSAIYHLPGMAAYARTAPDRCYRDAEAAATDGLRPAAR